MVHVEESPTEALPQPATVRFQQPESDDFDFAEEPRRGPGSVRVLAGPLAPPGQESKRLIRYDLLAGAALLLALLALVPLLLLRGDPEETSSAPALPPAGAPTGTDVEIELEAPVDLTDKVRLSWRASRDLDFGVVIAPAGQEAETRLAERNRTATIEIEPGLQYCFQIKGTDGDHTYKSEPVPFRGATCRE